MAALVAAAALLSSTPSLATRLLGPVVTGQITSVSGVEAVTIDGHQYPVKAGSPAADELPTLSQGQKVDVVLDGPPNSSTTHVVAITRHAG